MNEPRSSGHPLDTATTRPAATRPSPEIPGTTESTAQDGAPPQRGPSSCALTIPTRTDRRAFVHRTADNDEVHTEYCPEAVRGPRAGLCLNLAPAGGHALDVGRTTSAARKVRATGRSRDDGIGGLDPLASPVESTWMRRRTARDCPRFALLRACLGMTPPGEWGILPAERRACPIVRGRRRRSLDVVREAVRRSIREIR